MSRKGSKKHQTFRDKISLEQRKKLSERIRTKYSDRIPVIVDVSNDKSSSKVKLMKTKYLCPPEMLFGKLLFEVRNQMVDLKSQESIYMYLDSNLLPANSSTIAEIYNKNADPNDNLLYFTLSFENTFGCRFFSI